MNPSAARELTGPTPLGDSVGRWDGATLVVTTTRISWPFFSQLGIRQSPAVEIVERFTPDRRRQPPRLRDDGHGFRDVHAARRAAPALALAAERDAAAVRVHGSLALGSDAVAMPDTTPSPRSCSRTARAPGCAHASMQAIADAFERRGIATLALRLSVHDGGPQPRRSAGRRDAAIAEAYAAAAERTKLPIWLGGHSFGGRMASHAVVDRELPAAGLIFCSFPLHMPGKPDTKRAQHLAAIRSRCCSSRGRATSSPSARCSSRSSRPAERRRCTGSNRRSRLPRAEAPRGTRRTASSTRWPRPRATSSTAMCRRVASSGETAARDRSPRAPR